ncbi:unnamed protein product [Symbiodinium necroappetens]|uniref:Uncharacterized protein n=1 Tax=Symbiodinium necroappetens TaxID=1628268 RepID=A0A812RVP6_9DINO|nr:unnamed protein product [Symbiodinium necroappetens]
MLGWMKLQDGSQTMPILGSSTSRINMVERRGTVPRGCGSTTQSYYHTLAVVLGWFLA